MSLPDDIDLERVSISALEHFAYCPRQCGLIHVEATFDENLFTLRGRRAHERVDTAGTDTRPGRRMLYAVPLWSDRLGLIGRADAIEIGPDDTPYPVEHKVGRQRRAEHDDIQLCAQALCLEEMTGRPVPWGAVYYTASRARREVAIDLTLRTRTEAAIVAVRAMLTTAVLPVPVDDARCPDCSLIDACLPRLLAHPVRVRAWSAALYRDDTGDDAPLPPWL